MSVPTPYEALQAALQVISYEWAMRPDAFQLTDEIEAVEVLRAEAHAFSDPVPLAETYGSVVRLAALALSTLAALPSPDEVDSLRGFEGFDVWRSSR